MHVCKMIYACLLQKEEMMEGKEELDSGSGSEQIEGLSGNEQDNAQEPTRKKRYHRHTAHQIREMEAYDTPSSLCQTLLTPRLGVSG